MRPSSSGSRVKCSYDNRRRGTPSRPASWSSRLWLVQRTIALDRAELFHVVAGLGSCHLPRPRVRNAPWIANHVEQMEPVGCQPPEQEQIRRMLRRVEQHDAGLRLRGDIVDRLVEPIENIEQTRAGLTKSGRRQPGGDEERDVSIAVDDASIVGELVEGHTFPPAVGTLPDR